MAEQIVMIVIIVYQLLTNRNRAYDKMKRETYYLKKEKAT